jgi:hypothetical protein
MKSIHVHIFRILGSCVLVILLFSCISRNPIYQGKSVVNTGLKDTVEGVFLYEVNVPQKCYTRIDEIEQGNNLIYFDSLINVKEIVDLYTKGVYTLEFQPFLEPAFRSKGILQNRNTIVEFQKNIHPYINENDSNYHRNLYYDSRKILTFKKVYLKFECKNLGELSQLIPTTKNYKCCYSNMKVKLNTFYITEIFDYRVY